MAEAMSGAELATKADLQGEMGLMRVIAARIASVRGDLKHEIGLCATI